MDDKTRKTGQSHMDIALYKDILDLFGQWLKPQGAFVLLPNNPKAKCRLLDARSIEALDSTFKTIKLLKESL